MIAAAMRHRIPLTIVCLLTAGATFAAPIYKWTDAEGRVHYEDTRPAQADVQVIAPPAVYRGEAPRPSVGTPPSAATQAGTVDADERARKCAESRERLTEGQGAERMYTLDERGNRTYLTAAQIEAHVARLQEAVDTWCKEP